MLQNARVTALTVSELLRENQQAGKGGNYKITPPPPHTHTHTRPHTLIISNTNELLQENLCRDFEFQESKNFKDKRKQKSKKFV